MVWGFNVQIMGVTVHLTDAGLCLVATDALSAVDYPLSFRPQARCVLL